MAESRHRRVVGDDADPSVGAFVGALLPIRLVGGHTVTYGVWAGIHPAELQRVFGIWWEPEYQNLRLEGVLANSIAPWGLLGAPVGLLVPRPPAHPVLLGQFGSAACAGSPR